MERLEASLIKTSAQLSESGQSPGLVLYQTEGRFLGVGTSFHTPLPASFLLRVLSHCFDSEGRDSPGGAVFTSLDDQPLLQPMLDATWQEVRHCPLILLARCHGDCPKDLWLPSQGAVLFSFPRHLSSSSVYLLCSHSFAQRTLYCRSTRNIQCGNKASMLH